MKTPACASPWKSPAIRASLLYRRKMAGEASIDAAIFLDGECDKHHVL